MFLPSSFRLCQFVELALQRVEAQSSLRLSRTLGTPNIASKGKLGPRTVDIPLALFPPSHHLHQSAEAVKAKPAKKLIEEVTPETTPSGSSTTPNGGSSKNDNADTSLSVKRIETEATNRDANVSMETPMWSWRRDSESDRLVITVEVPKIVCRRFLLSFSPAHFYLYPTLHYLCCPWGSSKLTTVPHIPYHTYTY